mmetsp:Transcript_7503/g.17631  ORF Transcript_7503/g.17631 Transcript_7503/m.17631 type:complete len:214 (+) Transcript_7503:474-1115(+)
MSMASRSSSASCAASAASATLFASASLAACVPLACFLDASVFDRFSFSLAILSLALACFHTLWAEASLSALGCCCCCRRSCCPGCCSCCCLSAVAVLSSGVSTRAKIALTLTHAAFTACIFWCASGSSWLRSGWHMALSRNARRASSSVAVGGTPKTSNGSATRCAILANVGRAPIRAPGQLDMRCAHARSSMLRRRRRLRAASRPPQHSVRP